MFSSMKNFDWTLDSDATAPEHSAALFLTFKCFATITAKEMEHLSLVQIQQNFLFAFHC